MNQFRLFNRIAAVVALAFMGAGAHAANVSSVSRITFGPENILFVADWKASTVHALQLPPGEADAGKSFNFVNFDNAAQKALGKGDILLQDVVTRPGSSEVYVAVSYGPKQVPAILVAKADGSVRRLNLGATPSTSATLEKTVSDEMKFWRDIPGKSFTVTDMKFFNGKLYAAGISNQDFASTLRILGYPFKGNGGIATVEMYHTLHNQVETRAPIRAMAFTQLDGKPYLLAAYLCTPLVTIPVEALTDGAHIKAKTIAELGDAGNPVSIIAFNAVDMQTWKPVPSVLVANEFRESIIAPMASIEEANRREGMSKPVGVNMTAGVKTEGAPLSTVYRIADQNEKFFIALRRDGATGHSQLVSYDKAMGFRLTDYKISEYMFTQYQYQDEFQNKYIKPGQNMLKTQEGYPELVRP